MKTVNVFEMEDRVDMRAFSKIFNDDVKKVIDVVRKYGFDIRVVGGAVRDFLLGRDPRDVDFATDADPAELMFIFDLEGIDHDDSGIRHGTIKAVIGGQKIDVTSLGYRLSLKDGKVRVKKGTSWAEDSKQRDFTINSMSIDMNGNLYDYHGGRKDLEDQMVRFTSDPQGQIDEDPNRILRWFKAMSIFDNPKWKASDRKTIEKNIKQLNTVKDSRRSKALIADLQKLPSWPRILKKMCDTGAAQEIGLTCT